MGLRETKPKNQCSSRRTQPVDGATSTPSNWAPGLYTLYVGFLDTAANVHGTQIIDLQVPSFEGDALALSSVVMFSTMDKTDEVNGAPGKAFLLASHHFKPKGERSTTTRRFYRAYSTLTTTVSPVSNPI